MNRYVFSEAVNWCIDAKRSNFAIFVTILVLIVIPGTVTANSAADLQPVTNKMLLSAQDDPESWLMYGRDYRSWRYSQLKQVNTENVKRLVTKWAFQIGTPYDKFECTPLVVDGVMIITTPYSTIYAVDARTGVESILDPRAYIADAYKLLTIVTKDGEEITGRKRYLYDYRGNKNTEVVQILDSSGKLWTTYFTKDLQSSRVAKAGIMPENYADILSVKQMHDLLAYMFTL